MSAWKTKATNKADGEFPKAPPGNHPAVIVAMIDMGMQENDFKGVKTIQHRAYFCWELVNEAVAGTKGTRHVIGLDVTVSLNEKAKLRKWVEALFGKKIPEGGEFEVDKLLGRKCLLSISEKNGWPKVDGMAALPKGLACADPQHKPFLWNLTDIKEDGSIELPDWIPWLYGEPLKEHIRRRVTDEQKAAPHENTYSDPLEQSHEEAESESIPY